MPSDDWAIKVEGVSKSFRVHTAKNQTLKDRLIFAGRAKYRDFTALSDVSLTVRKGMTVGLLGVNGSGKSTLLKLISRILYPDTGSIHVRGKVSSLLELGAGFHPDFTGVENIFLNGSLMGLSKKEIKAKLDEIIEFSELGDFIGEPIRSYSSGMYMRLAFSVAVAVDPEILLVDEILAVGDAAFQAKCMDRIKRLQSQNRTIVIVTHDTGAVERLCNHAVWLHDSRIAMEGAPIECVQSYLQLAFQSAHEGANTMSFDRGERTAPEEDVVREQGEAVELRMGSRDVFLDAPQTLSARGHGIVDPGAQLSIAFNLEAKVPKDAVVLGVEFYTEDDVLVYGTDTKLDMTGMYTLALGERLSVRVHFPSFPLAPGSYQVAVRITTEAGEPLDIWMRCASVRVVADAREYGLVRMDHEWEIVGR